jgi:hypothetical protein
MGITSTDTWKAPAAHGVAVCGELRDILTASQADDFLRSHKMPR